jgi:hypothetical protein
MSPAVAAKKSAVGAAAKAMPYTGREYLDSLDDGREIWISTRSPSIRRFRTAHE